MKSKVRALAAFAGICLLSGCGKNSAVNTALESDITTSPHTDASLEKDGRVEASLEEDGMTESVSDVPEEPLVYPPTNGVQVYAVPEGAPASSDFEVWANDMPVGVYCTEVKTYYTATDSFGYFDLLEGTVEISVKPNFEFASCQILPESLGISPDVSEGFIRFETDQPQDFTFVFDGDYHGKVLQIFVSPPEIDIPQKGDPGVTYVEPGYYRFRNFDLKTGDTLYIAGGAFIEGGTIGAQGSDIKVMGRGVISQGEGITQGVLFNNCKNSSLEGIICNKRFGGWSGQIKNSDNITVERYRVVSPVYYSTDGLNIVCSTDITYKNCYFRTADDCVSIKGGTLDKPSDRPVENILLEDCIFWSDGNNAVAIGSETNLPYMRNITVRNCEILYVYDDTDNRGALAIICLHGTDISDIVYENINIGPCGHLISVFYTTSIFDIPGDLDRPGEIHDVTFRNIAQKGQKNIKMIRLTGWSKDKKLRNITFDNVTVEGQKVTEDYPMLKNVHIENVVFK